MKLKNDSAVADGARASRARQVFRNRLVLTTVLSVAPFMSYGRQAEAACVAPPLSSTYSCSGASGAETIAANNAAVTTVAGFSVNTAAGNGITITGDGALSYIDNNASPITSTDANGLYVRSTGNDAEIDGAVTIETNGTITGRTNGIYARNDGAGDMSITANGIVTGTGVAPDVADGIHARNDGNDLRVTTGAGGIVTGSNDGIDAVNTGAGELIIDARGEVTGLGARGIMAANEGTNLKITTGVDSIITGEGAGIGAYNQGSGNLDIKVYGQVTGLTDSGIYARNGYESGNGVDLTITTGAQSVITSGRDGIFADNFGSGKLEIIANGTVTANNDGIETYTSNTATDLIVTTGVGSTVTAGSDGIDAEHYGSGNLAITVNGKVTGFDRGIESDNGGSGYTSIIVGASGILEGDSAAINAESDSGQDIWITNNGMIRNLSGESHAVAIEAFGGDSEVENNGTLIGAVRFDEDDNRVYNDGFWNTAGGESQFGEDEFGDDNDRVYNSGTLVAADDAAEREETLFLGIEYFENYNGLVSLADGAAGDILRLIRDEFGDLTYYAEDDSRLAVDAVLGAGADGLSDVLFIDGDVRGDATRVSVNVVDALGANLLGIPVVDVRGDSGVGDFVLAEGPINAGFFSWDMRYDAIEGWHELYTAGIGHGAYEFAGGLTAAQDIWQQTTGTLAQRQADLRATLNGTQVTPVADFAEPVAPTAAGRVGPGFWFTAVGGYLDRDAEADGFTLDRKQSIYGGLAGFDFATEGAGDTWLFGIFGGYLSSTLKFSETNTKWTYDGPTVGAYATYLNDAFYADVTVKADFLSISIDPDDLAAAADDSDTDGVNLGGRIDTGYKIGGAEGVFVEPQATLAVVNTDIDDTEVFGGTVDFDNETSVKGRLGLKLGHELTASNAIVYSSDITASVWQEFNGSNGASISTPGLADFGVSDDTIETLGDISLGFGVVAPEGWSGFLRANYQFAEDFEAITGNAGVRYAF